MKTTNITKKIAAIFAAAMMTATVSVCASAEDVRVKCTGIEAIPEIEESDENSTCNIPRGGRVTVRVKCTGGEEIPGLEGYDGHVKVGVRV